MLGNDSNAMAQKAHKVGLKDGKIAIEGVDGFSIDVEDPKLNVGKLYSALFAGIDEPTTISLALRMNTCCIQRIFAPRDPCETCTLLKGFRTKFRNFEKFPSCLEAVYTAPTLRSACGPVDL